MGDVIYDPRLAKAGGGNDGGEPPAPPVKLDADPVGVLRAALQRARRRIWFETVATPRRGWRLLRYFALGVIGHRDTTGQWVGGWLGLVMWMFALRERQDALRMVEEKPGQQIRATEHADHIAVWHAAVIVIPHIAMAWAAQLHLGMWWLTFVPLIVATTIYGWRINPRPLPPIDPTRPGDVTREVLDGALRAIGILDKPTTNRPTPDGIRIDAVPRIVGKGQEIVWSLPPTVKSAAADVIRLRTQLASSLAIPLQQLHMEVGKHPGQVVMWYSKHDPWSTTKQDHPLLDTERWSVFDPIPFGIDHRGRRVSVPVMATHWLVGAIPRVGKTSASRVITAGPVLDPNCRIYVFDGKMGKDWAALEGVAEEYHAGPMREQAKRLHDLLDELMAEGDRRFLYLKSLPDDVCPDSAITPEIQANGMPFVWLVIDEAHKHLGDEQYGAAITHRLIQYVKGYPACGMSLLVCTQDAEGGIAERFTALRRVIGTRFALRVMDWRAADMILGEQVRTNAGLNAAEIMPNQKGTGIIRADLDADESTLEMAKKLRTYYMDNAAWRAICETGRELRARHQPGELPEPAGARLPEEWLSAEELLTRFRVLAADVLPEAVTTPRAMGEYLASRRCPAEKQNGAGQKMRRVSLVEVAVGLLPGSLGLAAYLAAVGEDSDVSATVSVLASGESSGPTSEGA